MRVRVKSGEERCALREIAVGQNVPKGGEVVNPTARTTLGVHGVGD
jgi:hypothetical protein